VLFFFSNFDDEDEDEEDNVDKGDDGDQIIDLNASISKPASAVPPTNKNNKNTERRTSTLSFMEYVKARRSTRVMLNGPSLGDSLSKMSGQGAAGNKRRDSDMMSVHSGDGD
jgi:hypothetical protein